MSGVTSCRQCGCSEIDTDPSRGDAVCTNCGFVLEESIIVSEVTFEEDSHGVASAVGQFVSADSRGGGAVGGGAGFHSGIGKESREITLRSAKKRITDVAQSLRLNQHCIEVAFNFFKMALHKQITKGRRHPLTIAACVYMTCRMEGTPHLLIDFSDVVQMDVYALGRAYLQISRALFINIPSVDPCMYILRFAHKFNLEPKTHEVSVTALRLVQRMKRDWIHFGRRPSGLCGAALLIAARIHGFSRTVQDIVNVVKVHETTLRRRLVEFGETPSSSLTMEEFMTVDLEEEHDPPAFKAARVKDRDQLQKLLDTSTVSDEFDDIQEKIESELERRRTKRKDKDRGALKRTHPPDESQEAEAESRAIEEMTITSINELLSDDSSTPPTTVDLSPSISPCPPVLPALRFKSETKVKVKKELKRELKAESGVDLDRVLMPPPSGPNAVIGYELDINGHDEESDEEEEEEEPGGELDLTGIDDSEIDGYIMNDIEAERKRILWERLNNEYIVSQEQKRIQMEEDIRNGKFDKKRKSGKERSGASKEKFKAKTAGEAIKIMLEKKLSSKINYEVLKSLSSTTQDLPATGTEIGLISGPDEVSDEFMTVIESGPVIPRRNVGRLDSGITTSGRTPRKRYKSESESISSLKSSSSVSVLIDPDTKSIILKPMKGDGEKDLPRSSSFTTERMEAIIDETEVVVESGPVLIESGPVPIQTFDPSHEEQEYADADTEEAYEDEDEDDGEGGLSASQLLTQFRGETGEGYEEDYY